MSEPPWGGSRRSNVPSGLRHNGIDSQKILRRPRVCTALIAEELLLALCGNIALNTIYEAILVVPQSYKLNIPESRSIKRPSGARDSHYSLGEGS